MIQSSLAPASLAILCAAILSILAEYLPGFSGWFDGLQNQSKQLLIAGLLAVVVAAILAGNCLGALSGVACPLPLTVQSIMGILVTYVLAVAANQGVYLILPKSS